MEQELLNEVRAFMAQHGVTASRFGLLAVNDKNFVRDLEGGSRRLLMQTADRVRRFMTEYTAPSSEAA
jgi:hypothetical protein